MKTNDAISFLRRIGFNVRKTKSGKGFYINKIGGEAFETFEHKGSRIISTSTIFSGRKLIDFAEAYRQKYGTSVRKSLKAEQNSKMRSSQRNTLGLVKKDTDAADDVDFPKTAGDLWNWD
jgi:hypothetical protein